MCRCWPNNLQYVKPCFREKVADRAPPTLVWRKHTVAGQAQLANRSGRDSLRVAPATLDAARDAPFGVGGGVGGAPVSSWDIGARPRAAPPVRHGRSGAPPPGAHERARAGFRTGRELTREAEKRAGQQEAARREFAVHHVSFVVSFSHKHTDLIESATSMPGRKQTQQ